MGVGASNATFELKEPASRSFVRWELGLQLDGLPKVTRSPRLWLATVLLGGFVSLMATHFEESHPPRKTSGVLLPSASVALGGLVVLVGR